MNNTEANGELELEGAFYTRNWDLLPNKIVSVKDIRKLLIDKVGLYPKPYKNNVKFELDLHAPHFDNPFTLARKHILTPRDRTLKYRVLHGDIFCCERMFKFKMMNTPNCTYWTNRVETIKHLIWDCPRSRCAWNQVNDIFRGKLGTNYINYETNTLGNQAPLGALETVIVWILRIIMSKDREREVTNEVIRSKIETIYQYEARMLGKTSTKFIKRWGNLVEIFDPNGKLIQNN
jgi:hypothetical protein